MSLKSWLINLLAGGLFLSGCTCQQDYDISVFDPIEDPNPFVPEDFGRWLSLDTAPDGVSLTLSYYDTSAGALGFAIGTPSANGSVAWSHEKVSGYPDSEGLDRGDRGIYTSHKVAPDGTVWVAYRDKDNGGLWFGHRVGTQWETDLVDAGSGSNPDAGYWADMALDSNGLPIIAHHDAGSGSLRVSTWDGENWNTEVALAGEDYDGLDMNGGVVHRDGNVGKYASLLVLGDTLHIACYDEAYQRLVLVEGSSGNYTSSVIDDSSHTGQWPDLMYWEDTLYVAYHDVENQNLMLASRLDDGTFESEEIDSGNYRGADTAIFVSNDSLGIAYFDGQENDLRLAVKQEIGDDAQWELSLLAGESGASGYHNDTTTTPAGTWIASYSFTDKAPHVILMQDDSDD